MLVIGQTPRDDLLEVLGRFPANTNLVVRGALDGVDDVGDVAWPASAYPLTTRLRDGTSVEVSEGYLLPLLQSALDECERESVSASVLLCAGAFEGLKSRRPLVRPFQIVRDILRELGMNTLHVIVPVDDQVGPSREKWEDAGFVANVVSSGRQSPSSVGEPWIDEALLPGPQVDAVVIDYVGHPLSFRDRLARKLTVPVIDLGYLAAAVLRAQFACECPDT